MSAQTFEGQLSPEYSTSAKGHLKLQIGGRVFWYNQQQDPARVMPMLNRFVWVKYGESNYTDQTGSQRTSRWINEIGLSDNQPAQDGAQPPQSQPTQPQQQAPIPAQNRPQPGLVGDQQRQRLIFCAGVVNHAIGAGLIKAPSGLSEWAREAYAVATLLDYPPKPKPEPAPAVPQPAGSPTEPPPILDDDIPF